QRSEAMNWDRVEGNWKEFKGKVQQKWGKLTSDDLDVIEGKRTQLSGRLQQRYGVAKDEAERQIDTWLNSANCRRQPCRKRQLGVKACFLDRNIPARSPPKSASSTSACVHWSGGSSAPAAAPLRALRRPPTGSARPSLRR